MLEDEKTTEQLEDEITLLKSQLKALTGESKELGTLMAQGMTLCLATVLHILVTRAPAVVSRATLHILFYGDRSDGGPEPKIFDVRISRIRYILKREARLQGVNTGKIETVWNAGYRASPDLVKWVRKLYEANITEK